MDAYETREQRLQQYKDFFDNFETPANMSFAYYVPKYVSFESFEHIELRIFENDTDDKDDFSKIVAIVGERVDSTVNPLSDSYIESVAEACLKAAEDEIEMHRVTGKWFPERHFILRNLTEENKKDIIDILDIIYTDSFESYVKLSAYCKENGISEDVVTLFVQTLPKDEVN